MGNKSDIQYDTKLNRFYHILQIDYPLVLPATTTGCLLGIIAFLDKFCFKNKDYPITVTTAGMLGNFWLLKLSTSGLSNLKIKESKSKTTFNDIAGTIPKQVDILVDYLRNPSIYSKLGARFQKGILMYGPPGSGKTLLARAIANEAGVPFFAISAPSIVNAFLGQSAQNIANIFTKARKTAIARNAPFSIVYFDEFDAIAKKRENATSTNESQHIVNELLTQLDGFNTDTRVVVIASTNFADSLDAALTRSERFNFKIEVKLPDIDARKKIISLYLDQITFGANKDTIADKIARETDGMSPADLKNIVNTAALIAAQKRADSVSDNHMKKACTQIKQQNNHQAPISQAAQMMYS